MKKEGLYSIGEISKICNTSVTALRYYGDLGVIKPAYIDEETGYRYYDSQALMIIPVMRYYQILGFKLKEIPHLLEREDLSYLKSLFEDKISSQKAAIERLTAEVESIESWHELIIETEEVIAKDQFCVTCREFPQMKVLVNKINTFPNMKFENLLINNEFCGSCFASDSVSLGALYLAFPSEKSRFNGDFSDITAYIKNHPMDDALDSVTEIGGFTVVACYHKGLHCDIEKTYNKMKAWAREHNFELRGDSLERYVIDYWSIKNSDWFITEILLPII